MRIRAQLGDNDDPNYSRMAYAVVNDDLWNKYKGLDEDNDDDYWTKRTEYWNILCTAMGRQNRLPVNWYVEEDFEEAEQ